MRLTIHNATVYPVKTLGQLKVGDRFWFANNAGVCQENKIATKSHTIGCCETLYFIHRGYKECWSYNVDYADKDIQESSSWIIASNKIKFIKACKAKGIDTSNMEVNC